MLLIKTRRWLRNVVLILLGIASLSAHSAVQIDGLINDDEWAGAIKFDQFVELAPLTSTPVPAPSSFHRCTRVSAFR